MIFISYHIGCRSCLQSDGVSHMTAIKEGRIEVWQDKSEFELMQEIEGDRTCEFCASQNVEILEINVNGKALYDYSRLIKECQEKNQYMLMFNIDKVGSDISLKHGGSQQVRLDFLKAALTSIFDTLKLCPINYFTPQIKGNFFICLTGGYDYFIEEFEIRVERLRCAGITIGEISRVLKPLADKAGLAIPIPSANDGIEKHRLEGKVFSGSLFNSWFYAESSDEAEKEGFPFSNACF